MPQVQGIDLASIFANVANLKAAKQRSRLLDLQIEQQEQANQQQQLLPEARQYAAQGRPEMLQMLDPNDQFFQQQQEQQQLQTQQQQAEQKQKANIARYAARTLQANPNAAPQVMQFLEQRGIQIDPNSDIMMQLEGVASPVLGAPEMPQQPLDAVAKYVINSTGLQPGTPEFMQAYKQTADQIEQQKLSRARAGATQIGIGDSALGLTKSQESKQQEKVLDAGMQLQQIGSIRQAIDTAGGFDAISNLAKTGEAALKGALSRLWSGAVTEEDRKEFGARADAVARMGAMTNQIISQLGGANVPPAEFKRLAESLPRPDDPPYVMESKLSAWEENLKLVQKYGIEALVNGIRSGAVSLPSAEQRQSRASTGQDARERAAQLRAQGLSVEQVGQRLKEEGFGLQE